MLASAIVITVLVVGAVVVWRAFGGGDSAGLTGADGTWNQIALINRTRGIVTTIDADGGVIGEFSGFSRILEAHVEHDRVALVGPNHIYVGSFDPEAAAAATTATNTEDHADNDRETSTTTAVAESTAYQCLERGDDDISWRHHGHQVAGSGFHNEVNRPNRAHNRGHDRGHHGCPARRSTRVSPASRTRAVPR